MDSQQELFTAPPSFEFPGAMDFLGLDGNEDLSSVSSMSSQRQTNSNNNNGYPTEDWGYMGLDDMASNSSLTPEDIMFNYSNGGFDNSVGMNNANQSPISSPSGSMNSSYHSDPDGRQFLPNDENNSNNSVNNSSSNSQLPITPPYLSYINPTIKEEDEESSQHSAGTAQIKQESESPKPALAAKTKVDTKNSKVTKPKKEKTSHNMIEKRYRTNINEKILALRDCVPSLRCVVDGSPTAEKELDGLTPASKLNKATVLTKATEYILHLQSKNELLVKELNELRAKLNGPAAPPVDQNTATVAPQQQPPPPPQYTTGPDGTPGFRPYPTTKSQTASKFMMCSMAGMMGAGMMQDSGVVDNSRGLYFFMPSSLFSFLNRVDTGLIFNVLRLSLIVATVVYVISPYFSNTASSHNTASSKPTVDTTAGAGSIYSSSSASKIHREVWDITSKSLDVPGTCNLSSLDGIVAWTYSFLVTFYQLFMAALLGGTSQFTPDSSSTLSRAIDAQLCGGDVNCSRLTLLLTFLKSLTLKPSVKRQMRQAVHIKILTYKSNKWLEALGHDIALSFWTKARKRSLVTKEELSRNYTVLLKSADVLSDDETISRLIKFAFDRSSQNEDEGFVSVFEDQGIRSVIDAMAAWYACKLKNEVMIECLETQTVNIQKLNYAAEIAPPNSIVRRRVAVVEAILLGAKDGQYIKKALSLINDEMGVKVKDNQLVSTEYMDEPPMVQSTSSNAIPTDCRLAIHCSIILYYQARKQYAYAERLLSQIKINPAENIDLLGFISLWITVNQMSKTSKCYTTLEKSSTAARVWIGSEAGENKGVPLNTRRNLVGQFLKYSAKFGGYDNDDEGYFSH
ncbi:hypothetical protein TRICI_004846 [Trichomonascus ciferrii]|uniref:BHLH domain-containing protein n=1 Tax=Trichomonascus ciferrii TaxID=44093 RepID=A0A642UYW8_9ASCO|nr:hypothetical protein TRICI_004846 [Trichomonascus ciferrii]